MSWGRVGHPSELFNISDRVKVVVLKFDRERERVSLGHKQITHDPWQEVDKKYPAKTRITGRVTSITDYGAFVELEQGVEGLVHISEMSWSRRVRHPSKIVNVNDVVEAVVLNVDKESKRISLGMKQMEDNPWDTIKEKYPVGSRVSGRVRNLTDFGAFLALDEGIDGLIHISDMSWTQRIKHPSEILKKGQPLEAVVLNVDAENERLSLGLSRSLKTPGPTSRTSTRWGRTSRRHRQDHELWGLCRPGGRPGGGSFTSQSSMWARLSGPRISSRWARIIWSSSSRSIPRPENWGSVSGPILRSTVNPRVGRAAPKAEGRGGYRKRD